MSELHQDGASSGASTSTSSGTLSASSSFTGSSVASSSSSVTVPPLTPRTTNLTGRISIPLPIPVATDLVRKPTPQHAVESLGVLCRAPLAKQNQHLTGAVQTLISREGCIATCSSALDSLTSALSQTDHLMAQLVDGMGRLDLILSAAARPLPPPATVHTMNGGPASSSIAASVPSSLPTAASPTDSNSESERGMWCSLKPAYLQLVAAQARVRQPMLFKRGMMERLNTPRTAAVASSTSANATAANTPTRKASPAPLNTASASVSSTSCASSTVPASAVNASIQSATPPATPLNSASSTAPVSPSVGDGAGSSCDTACSSSSSSSTAILKDSQGYIIFRPVHPQAPLCKVYQKWVFGGKIGEESELSCSVDPTAPCPYLHVFEEDTKPFRAYRTDDLPTASEREEARKGLPYILYHLPTGEEAQFSLLRRTLDQYAPTTRRTLFLRHARIHWAKSLPSDRSNMTALMRPTCRIIHFQGYTELTHKHRFQAALRRRASVLEGLKQTATAATDAASSSSSSSTTESSILPSLGSLAYSFYPRSFLLPADREELLKTHRALGGKVAPELEQECATPTLRDGPTKRKAARVERFVGGKGAVASTSMNGSPMEDPETASPSSSLSPSPITPASANGSLTTSSDAVIDPSLWLRFPVPNFKEKWKGHWNSVDGGSSASSSTAAPLWILKPYNRGGGCGIRVTDFVHHVHPQWITEQFVCSRYIASPLLLDKSRLLEAHELEEQREVERKREKVARLAAAAGKNAQDTSPVASSPSLPSSSPSPSLSPLAIAAAHKPDLRKFDLRLYVLLLSPFFPPSPSCTENETPKFPFQVFLYHNGLARFASEPYDPSSLSPENLGKNLDPFIHITNNSINVNNPKRRAKQKGAWENTDLDALRRYFSEERSKNTHAEKNNSHIWSWSYIESQLHHLILSSLLVSDEFLAAGLSRENKWNFELFGLDVLIDAEFRVHLCEWNSLPDLNSSTPGTGYHGTFPMDQKVKGGMLADLLTALKLKESAAEEEEEEKSPSPSTSYDSVGKNIGGFERII